jgi:hypothetical protein
VIKLLTVDIARSRTETRIVRLVQRISMLESELDKLRAEVHGKVGEKDGERDHGQR